ncbi:MAG: restriction endonuclease [Candidatus Tectimicrobiota bacterium]|nr:MAG: restriction endonuclease [Candidatus Tectomicrobia bacterium]
MVQELAITQLVETSDARTVLVPPRPLTFDEFVDLFGEDDDVELIDGVVVRRMAARYSHEDLFGWLYVLLRSYVAEKGLGIVLGSRTAVQITAYRGRLPDILFVRQERVDIVQEKGIYGAPDLVIEIISPGDRPADLIALETDYRSLGVTEIWFVDQRQKQVRVLRKRDQSYVEEVLRQGVVPSEVVEGFWLEVAWLFAAPRPSERDALRQILGSPP